VKRSGSGPILLSASIWHRRHNMIGGNPAQQPPKKKFVTNETFVPEHGSQKYTPAHREGDQDFIGARQPHYRCLKSLGTKVSLFVDTSSVKDRPCLFCYCLFSTCVSVETMLASSRRGNARDLPSTVSVHRTCTLQEYQIVLC